MTPEQHDELYRQVGALIHAQMPLLQTFLTKRVMLMFEAADEMRVAERNAACQAEAEPANPLPQMTDAEHADVMAKWGGASSA